MRTITTLIAVAGLGLAQTPLTNEEKLGIENASLKLQLIDAQRAEVQKAAQSVFESACKRAGIDLSACQFDQKSLAVSKAPAPAKPEAKK